MGLKDIECLGHIEAVQRDEGTKGRRRTKKQIRSFLDVVGFYRKFIANFAAVAVPFTNLMKNGQPSQLIWIETQERSFAMVKRSLIGPPVLKLSGVGQNNYFAHQLFRCMSGCCEGDEIKLPVAYASRKLLDRKRNYAAIGFGKIS